MEIKQLKSIFLEYNISSKGQSIFKNLYVINTKLLDTINFEILTDKFISTLSFEELSRIVCDKKFQDTLINLNDNQYDLFLKLKTFLNKDNWITGSSMIVKALNNHHFNRLYECILQNNNKKLLKNYFNFINQDQNYFGIENIEQLENYEEIKKDVCNLILDNPENTEGMSDYIKNLSTLDRVKFAIIEKNYNISLNQAKLLCQKYGFNITYTQEIVGNEKIHSLLRNLTQIISAKDLNQVKEVELTAENIGNFNYIDTQIRANFAQIYNDAFYKPSEKDLIEKIEFNGNKIPIYNAGTNFYMCTHVVGAFSSGNKDNVSYPESWNRPNRRNHAFCTRIISNESLELTKENAICYGFTDFENNTLLASAPWDMSSIEMNKKFDTIGTMDIEKNMYAYEGSGSRFLTPIEQANNTRTDGNETIWDRFNSNGERKQPSYIIYIADSMKNKDYKNDSNYEKSLMVASQHNIPLVIIDREKVIEKEHLEIEHMLQEYEKTQNPLLINRIIQKFENNRTTCFHQKNEEKYQSEFPLRNNTNYLSLETLVNKIVNISKDKKNNHAIYQQIIDELLNQAVRSPNNEKDFYDIVYQVADLNPSLSVNIDKALIMKLGITQKDIQPQLSSKYYFKCFYYRRKKRITSKDSQNKKFNTNTLDEDLQKLSSEITISGINDMLQNIRNLQRLNNQEQSIEDKTFIKKDKGWCIDD